MKNLPFITIAARVNAVIAFILVSDSFIIKPITITEQFTESSHKFGRGTGRYGSSSIFYVHCASGRKYHVPEYAYMDLSHERNQFMVDKSRLLRVPLQIHYSTEDGSIYNCKIGLLNGRLLTEILIGFILITSLLNIPRKPVIPSKSFNERTVLLSSFLLIPLLILYFF